MSRKKIGTVVVLCIIAGGAVLTAVQKSPVAMSVVPVVPNNSVTDASMQSATLSTNDGTTTSNTGISQTTLTKGTTTQVTSAHSWRGFYLTTPSLDSPSKSIAASASAGAYDNPDILGVFLRLSWSQINPAQGTYDWSLLDKELEPIIRLHKKISIGVQTGDLAPDWLASAGIPQATFQTVGSRSKNTCTDTRVFLPWDVRYQTAYGDLMKAIADHLRARGVYDQVTIIKLTGINQDNLQLRLPNTGKDCLSGNTTIWKQVGYAPSKVVSAWEALAKVTNNAFSDKVLSIAPLEDNAFPALNESGDVVDRDAAFDIKQAIYTKGKTLFPGRFLVQDQALNMWTEPEILNRAKAMGIMIGWQTSNPSEGADCKTQKKDVRVACTTATYQKILERGFAYGGEFIEVWPVDILAFPSAYGAVCVKVGCAK